MTAPDAAIFERQLGRILDGRGRDTRRERR